VTQSEITPESSAHAPSRHHSRPIFRSRLRLIVALGSAMVVVIVVIGIVRYQPISTGVMGVSTNVVSTPNGSQVAQKPDVGVERTWIMPSRKAVVEVVATLSNGGPLSVEISNVGAPVPVYFAPLNHMSRLKVRAGRSSSWNRDGAFRPFVL